MQKAIILFKKEFIYFKITNIFHEKQDALFPCKNKFLLFIYENNIKCLKKIIELNWKKKFGTFTYT